MTNPTKKIDKEIKEYKVSAKSSQELQKIDTPTRALSFDEDF